MRPWYLILSLVWLMTARSFAGVYYLASINDVQVGGAHQLAGSFGVSHGSNDFDAASPETPIYMEYYFGKNSVLAHTLVDLTSSDSTVNAPIYLPLAFDYGLNTEDLTIAAPPETISIVRWVQGENTIWIRIQASTSTWVRFSNDALGPPTKDVRVYWIMGVSARAYAEALDGVSANLPFASRNPSASPDDAHEAVSTLFCLDLTQASLASSGIDSALPYDTFFSDHTSEVTSGVYERGNVLDIHDSGDFRIARGRDVQIKADVSTTENVVPACDEGMGMTRNLMALHIYHSNPVSVYGRIFDGSRITLNTPPNSNYGFQDNGVLFHGTGLAPGILEVDQASAFFSGDEILYRQVQLTWNGGTQQLDTLSLSLDATVHYPCNAAPSDIFIQYQLDMTDYPTPVDDAPFDGPQQQRNCEQTVVPRVSGLWRHSALQDTGMIAHVTRANQGFTTRIIIANTAEEPQSYVLYPYSEDGLSLPEVTGELEAGQTATWSSSQLFNSDQVSHFRYAVSSQLAITAVYQANREETGPAHVGGGTTSSTRWRIYPGNSEVTWDGMAVVNRGGVPAPVTVTQYNEAGEVLQEEILNEAMVPMAKQLMVLSEVFQPVHGSYYEIAAPLSLSIISLRGDLNSNFLWQNTAIPIP